MIVSSRAAVFPFFALLFATAATVTFADEPALRLKATVTTANAAPLTIELLRWSTDAERAPLLAALAPAPPPAPARGAATPAAPAQGGRGGRGGRGAAAPLSPAARLSAAVKAAPTVGFIWGDGPTGYAIKYAWRDTDSAPRRVVLVTDRRIGAHWPSWPQASAAAPDAEFTLLEMRVDASGVWEAKASLTAGTAVDAAAQTLALDGYATAPVLLRVTP